MVGATAAIAAAALAVAGCGSSNAPSSGSSAQIGSSAISQAADISGAAKGEKVSYTLTEQLPSVGKLTMTGSGQFNVSPEQGQMTLDISIPGLSSLGSEASALSKLPLTLVIDNKVVYVKLPSALASKLSTYTAGKPWVSVNLAALASSSSIPGLSTLLSGQSSPTNPAATLKELEAASSNGITQAGTAEVNGVATTEYKATLDLSKLSGALPAAERKVLKPELAQISTQAGLTQIPFEVYIDSAHLIRRLTMSFTPQAQGTKIPVTMQMNFLSYGKQPAPTLPSAADTDDLTSLLSSLGSTMSGSSGPLGG